LLRSRGEVTPSLILKDPYVLDFLGLSDRFLERDLEDAILRELETFLLELAIFAQLLEKVKLAILTRTGPRPLKSLHCSTAPETLK
jgi:predicted nuclease of restriction endonuclease-like (RecB) superfamily